MKKRGDRQLSPRFFSGDASMKCAVAGLEGLQLEKAGSQ